MTRSLQIAQITFVRRALLLGMPGAFAGVLIILILAPSSVSALSLSVKLGAQVPLIAPVSARADVSLLEPATHTLAGVSAGVTSPAGSVASPPVTVPSPALPVDRSPALDIPTPSQIEPVSKSGLVMPAATVQPAAAAASAPRAQVPEAAVPEAFDFMPETFSGNNKDFTLALVVLTAMAVLFMSFATYTTTRLARGSPLH